MQPWTLHNATQILTDFDRVIHADSELVYEMNDKKSFNFTHSYVSWYENKDKHLGKKNCW